MAENFSPFLNGTENFVVRDAQGNIKFSIDTNEQKKLMEMMLVEPTNNPYKSQEKLETLKKCVYMANDLTNAVETYKNSSKFSLQKPATTQDLFNRFGGEYEFLYLNQSALFEAALDASI